MQRSFKSRMEALERARWARLDALDRACELAERGTPPRAWPDAELYAFADAHCQHLRGLSDSELEAMLEH